jgi:hypothetical protein
MAKFTFTEMGGLPEILSANQIYDRFSAKYTVPKPGGSSFGSFNKFGEFLVFDRNSNKPAVIKRHSNKQAAERFIEDYDKDSMFVHNGIPTIMYEEKKYLFQKSEKKHRIEETNLVSEKVPREFGRFVEANSKYYVSRRKFYDNTNISLSRFTHREAYIDEGQQFKDMLDEIWRFYNENIRRGGMTVSIRYVHSDKTHKPSLWQQRQRFPEGNKNDDLTKFNDAKILSEEMKIDHNPPRRWIKGKHDVNLKQEPNVDEIMTLRYPFRPNESKSSLKRIERFIDSGTNKKIMDNILGFSDKNYDKSFNPLSDAFAGIQSYQADPFMFFITHSIPDSLGADKSVLSSNNKTIKGEYYTYLTRKIKNNNCLLTNLLALIKIKSFGLEEEHLAQVKKQKPALLKELIGIEINEAVPVDKIHLIEDILKVRINVYLDKFEIKQTITEDSEGKTIVETATEPVYLYKSEKPFQRTAGLLAIPQEEDYHIYVIKEKINYCYSWGGVRYIRKSDKTRAPTVAENKQNIAKLVISGKQPPNYVKKKPKKGSVKPKQQKNGHIFFDVETVYNPLKENGLEPISVAYFYTEEEHFEFDIDKHVKQTKCFHGPDCMDQFMKDCMRIHANKYRNFSDFKTDKSKIYLISYNGSKFDNYFIMEAVSKYSRNIRPFFCGGKIISMQFSRFELFDICLFTLCSLKKACDDFKTKPSKIDIKKINSEAILEKDKIPDFDDIQKLFLRGELFQFLETETGKKFLYYNKIDVLALVDLFFKIKSVIPDLMQNLTIGGLALRRFKEGFKDNSPPLCSPKSYDDYKFMRKSYYGGRTCMFKENFGNGENTYVKEEDVRMVDVVSLYPFVMKICPFPTGNYKETDEYVPGKMGIYNILSVEGKMPHSTVLPTRHEDGTLNWEVKSASEYTSRGKEMVLNTVDIDSMLQRGYKLEIGSGIYWDDCSRVFTKFVRTFMKIKEQQDILKRNRDPKYNPTLRNISKLILNALSGKVSQQFFQDLHLYVSDYKGFKKAEDKVRDGYTIRLFSNGAVLDGKRKNEDDGFKYYKHYTHIASFIYAYARKYMYDMVFENYKALYSDTDSAILPLEEYKRFARDNSKILFNGIGTKQFGDFEEEICCPKCDEGTKKIYILQKKLYRIDLKCKCAKKRYPHKLRMKGINKSAIIVTPEIEKVLRKFGIMGEVPEEKMNRLGVIVKSDEKPLICKTSKQSYVLTTILNDKRNKKGSDPIIYDILHQFGSCKILQPMMTKTFSAEYGYKIHQVFMIKKIKLQE